MPTASIKGKYGSDSKAVIVLGTKVDDVKLKAALTERTLADPGALHALKLSVERPGHFQIDYEPETNITRFQFHQKATFASRNVDLTLVHAHGMPVTSLEAKVALDSRNKVFVKHNFIKQKPSIKYEYVHDPNTTLKPGYDFATDSWTFTAKQRLGEHGSLEVTYNPLAKRSELNWESKLADGPPVKITASLPVGGKSDPLIVFEKEWNFKF